VRSIQASSVRGVMIARTGLSARRSTRSIMSRFLGSSTPACGALGQQRLQLLLGHRSRRRAVQPQQAAG
jgi:hypothetical protein